MEGSGGHFTLELVGNTDPLQPDELRETVPWPGAPSDCFAPSVQIPSSPSLPPCLPTEETGCTG